MGLFRSSLWLSAGTLGLLVATSFLSACGSEDDKMDRSSEGADETNVPPTGEPAATSTGAGKESSGYGDTGASMSAPPNSPEYSEASLKAQKTVPGAPPPTGQWELGDDQPARPHGEPWDNPLGAPENPSGDGPYEESYEDGQLKFRGAYKSYRQDGFWQAWWPNGQLRQQGHHEVGYQDGLWEAWYENGNRRGRGTYIKGRPNGDFNEWHPDGSLWQLYSWVDGNLHGYWYMLNPDGSKDEEGYYDLSRPDGHWKLWHPDGTLAEENFWDKGKKIGTWKLWHENGQLVEESTHRDGQIDGSMRAWYPTGLPQAEGHFDVGLRTGSWAGWYPNGQERERFQFVVDAVQDGSTPGLRRSVPDGPVRGFTESGELIFSGEWKRGKPVGSWYCVDESGKSRALDLSEIPSLTREAAPLGADEGSALVDDAYPSLLSRLCKPLRPSLPAFLEADEEDDDEEGESGEGSGN